MDRQMEMEGAKAFEGYWQVDKEESDSLEPMLRAMGVPYVVRKIAKSLVVVQQIEVKGNEFIVTNISKHARDKTVHYMNAGERTITTDRGDKVVDDCTWDETREFPLKILAKLPGDKGFTEDHRKMNPGGNSFTAHLIYRYPKGVDKPKIVMRRKFVRVEDDSKVAKLVNNRSGEATKENGEVETVKTEIEEEPSPRPPPLVEQSSSTMTTGLAKATSSNSALANSSTSPPSALLDTASHEKPGTGRLRHFELWILVGFSVLGFTLVNLLHRDGVLTMSQSGSALVILTIVYGFARLTVDSDAAESDKPLPKMLYWILVPLVIMACVGVEYYVVPSENANGPLKASSILFALIMYGTCRFAIGFDTMKASPGEYVKPLTMNQRWAILACFLGAATLAYYNENLQSTILLVSGSLAWRMAVQMAGEQVLEPGSRPGETQEEETKSSQKDLEARVVDYRIVQDMYAQYKIEVSCDEGDWTLWRRFSQFDYLRSELRKFFGPGVLPKLPAKTYFTSMDDDFLEKRKADLDAFLRELLSGNAKDEVKKMKALELFLGLGQDRARKQKLLKEKEEVKPDPSHDPEIIEVIKKGMETITKADSIGEGDGWKFYGKVNGVQCYLKKEGELTYTKGVGVMDAPVKAVVGFTNDPVNRPKFDELYKRHEILHELDAKVVSENIGMQIDFCDIRHIEFNSPFPMAISPRDAVVVNCRWLEPETGTAGLLMTSVKGFKEPSKKYVRAFVFAGGVFLRPLPQDPENKCTLSNVQMMDPNGSIPGWIVSKVAPERAAMSAKINACLQDKKEWEKYMN